MNKKCHIFIFSIVNLCLSLRAEIEFPLLRLAEIFAGKEKRSKRNLKLNAQTITLLRLSQKLEKCQRTITSQAVIIQGCKRFQEQCVKDYRNFFEDIRRQKARADFFQQLTERKISPFIFISDTADL